MKHSWVVVLAILIGIVGYLLWHQKAEAPEETSLENNEQEQIVTNDVIAHIAAKSDLIVVESPVPKANVTSPVEVSGIARGYWFFEASFPIIVTDWDGKIIGEGYATAQGDWMTEDFVPFSGTVSFVLPESSPYQRGTIIFKRDNPSGLSENDDALEIPVLF